MGAAITQALANAGADVTATYTNEPGQRVWRTAYGAVATVPYDVRESLAILEPARMTFDILINNAGITAGRSILKTMEDDWENVLDVNLSGAWRMMRQCLPHMLEQKWGRIINISSVVGLDGRLGPAPYAASKAGLVGLTKSAAHELAAKGITVNAVAPGFIQDTGMVNALPDHVKAGLEASIPMGRLGCPEDVAQAVLYLVNAPYVTGEVLNVSGGYLT